MDPALPGPETEISLYEDGSGNRVREFRINGALFQIQGLPVGAAPYYLVDQDGDGQFETRLEDTGAVLVLPTWVLFRGRP